MPPKAHRRCFKVAWIASGSRASSSALVLVMASRISATAASVKTTWISAVSIWVLLWMRGSPSPAPHPQENRGRRGHREALPGIAAPVTSAVFGDWRGCCSCSRGKEPPWGRRGGVPRGEHGTHSEGWAGDKDCGAAAPFSVLSLLLSVALDQLARSVIPVLDPIA